MKIYKCDGKRFEGEIECNSETKYETKDGFPERWLTVKGTIVNGLPDPHLISSETTMHFCSYPCLFARLSKKNPFNK